MRIVYFANNRLGWQILEWLNQHGVQIAAVVLNSPEKRKYGEELVRAAGAAPIIDGARLRDPRVIARLREMRPNIGLSVLFGHILRPQMLGLFPRGVVNLHPSLLPYNRGASPNVWSIVEGTPAGVSLHYIDERIDTGDILAQQQVPVEPVDTGATLYRKLEAASLDLFQRTWPSIEAGMFHPIPQPAGAGTYHATRDLEALDEIDLDRTYTARELIDLLRARTFPPYRGAWFRHGRRRVYLRLELEYGD